MDKKLVSAVFIYLFLHERLLHSLAEKREWPITLTKVTSKTKKKFKKKLKQNKSKIITIQKCKKSHGFSSVNSD